MAAETLTSARDDRLTVELTDDGAATVLYDGRPLAVVVIPEFADGSDGYYLAGHPQAGVSALEPGRFLVATWHQGGDWHVLHTGRQADTLS